MLKQRVLQEGARKGQATIEINGRHDSLIGISENCGFVTPARLLFAAAEPQIVAETQAASRTLQGTSVHDSSSAFGKLAFGPTREIREQVLASEEFENRIAEELEAFVVLSGNGLCGVITGFGTQQLRQG